MIIKIKYFLPLIVLIAGFSISYAIIIQAQTPEIVYPIKELGDCQNETECRNFCDNQENIVPCVAFAEKHNLISPEEAAKAKAFAKMGEGPGGCKSKDECEAFCDNQNNLDICLDFAEKNNLMPEDELEEARLVAKAVREGARLPGGCKNKKECEAFCDNPENMDECLNFAEKAGFIPPDELAEARQATKAMKAGIKPPGNCRGKKQCEIYCQEPENAEECLAFAEAAGFIPKEEVEMARKIIPMMARGEMPGGCRGKEECDAYCQNESHAEECADFALKAGLMKPEEAEMFRKTGGNGPGKCRGKEECEAFCNNPDNQEICFNFAKEHDLIPREEIEKMKEGMKQMKEGMEMAPPEVKECLRATIGEEILNKIQNGELTPGPQIGDSVRNCFERFMPQRPQGPENFEYFEFEGEQEEIEDEIMPDNMPFRRFNGPGGCQSPEECQKYCLENQEECAQFRKPKLPSDEESERPFEMMKEMLEENLETRKQLPPNFQPPEGFKSPEKFISPEEYKEIYQQQYDKYRQMMEGEMAPPGGLIPPQEFIPPTGETMPNNEIIPPSPAPTEPLPAENLGSNAFGVFLKLFKELLR